MKTIHDDLYGKNYENHPHYLAELTSHAAIEIDNLLLGRKGDFSSIERFARVLKKYQSKDVDTILTDFLYIPLWKAMKMYSQKEIRHTSELVLEIKILQSEISKIKNLPKKRLENLRDFCVKASKEFQIKGNDYLRKVA